MRCRRGHEVGPAARFCGTCGIQLAASYTRPPRAKRAGLVGQAQSRQATVLVSLLVVAALVVGGRIASGDTASEISPIVPKVPSVTNRNAFVPATTTWANAFGSANLGAGDTSGLGTRESRQSVVDSSGSYSSGVDDLWEGGSSGSYSSGVDDLWDGGSSGSYSIDYEDGGIGALQIDTNGGYVSCSTVGSFTSCTGDGGYMSCSEVGRLPHALGMALASWVVVRGRGRHSICTGVVVRDFRMGSGTRSKPDLDEIEAAWKKAETGLRPVRQVGLPPSAPLQQGMSCLSRGSSKVWAGSNRPLLAEGLSRDRYATLRSMFTRLGLQRLSKAG